MESPYISQLRLSQGIGKYLDLRSHQMTLKLHYEMLKEGISKEDRFIFTEVIMPPEIFHSMGLIPLFVESLGSFLASIKKNTEIIKAAEEDGINPEICAYHKCGIGALKSGYIPVPRLFIHSSYWCDDMVKVCSMISREFKREAFLIDIPFTMDERSVEYIAEQLEDMVEFITYNTGLEFSMDKLKECVRLSNQAREYWVLANKLRENPPAVLYGSDALRMLPMLLPKFGLKENVEVFKVFYEEIRSRYDSKKYCVKKQKSRILWLHFMPFYDPKLIRYLENDLGVVIAFEENCNVFWEPIDQGEPFIGLARKLLGHTGFGPANRRIEAILDLVKKYHIDGVIHFSQVCCRPFSGMVSLLRQELRRSEIPFLEIDGDVVDSRNYAQGQTKVRLEAFVEMLQS